MTKRLFTLLLAALMLLASCSTTTVTDTTSNGETEETETTETAETATETVEEEPEESIETVKAAYADRDYGGYAYKIADRATSNTDWYTFDVYTDELTGEAVNDAVYNRNIALEDTINIKVTEMRESSPASTVKASVLAGSDDYDIVTDGLYEVATSLAVNKYVLDLDTLDNLKLTEAWWDQSLQNELKFYGHSYMMTGDISVMDNNGTWCYLFNKTLITNLHLDNPYELVDTGKWTLDKHNEMAAAATQDVDGNGVWNAEDIYGFLTEGYNTFALWQCFGFTTTRVTEDNKLEYCYNNDASITALQKVIDTQYADFTNEGLGSTVVNGGSFQVNTRENQFATGKALFYYAGMRNVTLFRDSDTDFGIIPAPKYNEDQEQYYSSYSRNNSTIYSIPITVADSAMIADITEAMAEMSTYTLTPAYYDITLKGKSARDTESEPMIDLIMETRCFDAGLIFDIGSVANSIMNMKDSGTVASTFSKGAKAAQKMLEKIEKNFLETEE